MPYRSLEFRFETLPVERFQNAAVVNYPNHQEYTRITEFKQLYLQQHPETTICYEYGSEEGPACYPIPTPANHALYARYRAEADRLDDTHFVGRLAQYQYLNMDQVVEQSVERFSRDSETVPENKPERIAAIVVTYNRKQLLGECLDSLLAPDASARRAVHHRQRLDRRDAVSILLRPAGIDLARRISTSEVHYVRMPENAGGAGGFAEGMERAAAAGFDWLWLMDDDVLAAPDALDVLVRKKERA